MNLNEFIYQEEMLNDEELNEALRVFKESNKFRKYADKIEAKLITAKSKGKIESDKAKMVQDVVSESRMAAKEFERVEDKFKGKELDRKKAKEEVRRLKKKYSGLAKKIKSDKVKAALKIIGAGALLAGLAGVLGGVFGIGTGTTQTLITGSEFQPGKIYNF